MPKHHFYHQANHFIMTSTIRYQKVLVSGMSGLIGGIVGRDLARRGYEVSALNRQSVPGFKTTCADITDLEAIRPAFENIDAVVHMAAYLGPSHDKQIEVNIKGTYNIYEAAKESGVKRFVFGSSGATQKQYETDESFKAMVEARYDDIPEPSPLIYHHSAPRPGDIYGVAKLAGENLGRYYAELHDMSVICIRLGRVTAEDRPDGPRNAAVHLSHRDAAQIVWRCLEARANISFGIVYGVSDNRTRFRDLEHTQRLVGYQPLDGVDWETVRTEQ